jgi:ketosteroid isomerase-like protein
MTDEDQIRELIQRWAAAVHTGDMATVLADHAPDIRRRQRQGPHPARPAEDRK